MALDRWCVPAQGPPTTNRDTHPRAHFAGPIHPAADGLIFYDKDSYDGGFTSTHSKFVKIPITSRLIRSYTTGVSHTDQNRSKHLRYNMTGFGVIRQQFRACNDVGTREN
jgi:hypothetical protein